MKKLLFTGACLWAFAATPVLAQTTASDVVVMSVRTLVVGRVRVVLAYPGGKTEEQLVETMGNSDKNQDQGTSAYQRIIGSLYQQGYSVRSTFTQDEGRFTVLVFARAQ